MMILLINMLIVFHSSFFSVPHGPTYYTKACTSPQKNIHCRSPSTTRPKSVKEIKFYNVRAKYGGFTNFYPSLISIDGITWRTTEHYFQAQKFIGTPYVEHIRSFRTAREAFQFSREQRVQPWIRSDWHSVKDEVMKKALLYKFSQNKDLRKLLLDTEDKKLIEHTANDSYWGDGGDGSGRNKLGELLMEVRDVLRPKVEAKMEMSPWKRRISVGSLPFTEYNSKSTDKLVDRYGACHPSENQEMHTSFPPIVIKGHVLNSQAHCLN